MNAEQLIFEISHPGRVGVSLPACDVPERPVGDLLPGVPLRAELNLPEVAQIDLMRHFVKLSQKNFSIDTNFYPLGSCTMKFNPKVHEDVVRFSGFADLLTTIPSTLGLFDETILEVTRLVHEVGGLIYCDGANLNAVVGQARFGDLGGDVMHFNLHKTFTTPHGGGGPGAGPVGVKAHLEPFLPVPVVTKDGDEWALDWKRPRSIGKLQAFWGNFGMLVRAYTYIRTMRPDGLRSVSDNAILNANYIMKRLEQDYDVAVPGPCLHECVLSARRQKKLGVTATDIAKRLLDLGFYAPSTYFPLIVEEALMIEPTETESKETLDAFCDAMIQIAREAESNAAVIHDAPVTTPVRRLDQTKAAREPDLRWTRRP